MIICTASIIYYIFIAIIIPFPTNRIFKYKNTASTSSNLIREYVRIGFNISVHELRHTYATNLIQNGIDFKTTAKLLGHTVEMTLNVYSHVTDDMMKRATKIINNYF